ncbi:MAG: hypothetical protein ACOZAA_08155 [Pseudomonadota bacterium]
MKAFDDIIVKDANGHVVREYDDVELLRSTVFSRHDGDKILTHVVPKGGAATVILIFEQTSQSGSVSVLELEANDGVFFHFELPENIAFAKAREEKLSQGSAE